MIVPALIEYRREIAVLAMMPVWGTAAVVMIALALADAWRNSDDGRFPWE